MVNDAARPVVLRTKAEGHRALALLFGGTAEEVLSGIPVEERIAETAQKIGALASPPISSDLLRSDAVWPHAAQFFERLRGARAAKADAARQLEIAEAALAEAERQRQEAERQRDAARHAASDADAEERAAAQEFDAAINTAPATHTLYVWQAHKTRNDVQIKIGRTTNFYKTEREYKRPCRDGQMVFSAPIASEDHHDSVENAAQSLLPHHFRMRGDRNGLSESFIIPVGLYNELLDYLRKCPQPITCSGLRDFTGGRLF